MDYLVNVTFTQEENDLIAKYPEAKEGILAKKTVDGYKAKLDEAHDLIVKLGDDLDEAKNELASGNAPAIVIAEAIRAASNSFIDDKAINKNINEQIYKMHLRTNHSMSDLYNHFYTTLEMQTGINLTSRLKGLIKRKTEAGATKSIIDATTRIDVILLDPKIKMIFRQILVDTIHIVCTTGKLNLAKNSKKFI